jgi:hypothetical protein
MEDIYKQVDAVCTSLAGYATCIPPVLSALSSTASFAPIEDSALASTAAGLHKFDKGGAPAVIDETSFPDPLSLLGPSLSSDENTAVELLRAQVSSLQYELLAAQTLKNELLGRVRGRLATEELRRLYDKSEILTMALNEADDLLGSAAALLSQYGADVSFVQEDYEGRARSATADAIALSLSAFPVPSTLSDPSGLRDDGSRSWWNPRYTAAGSVSNLTLARLPTIESSSASSGVRKVDGDGESSPRGVTPPVDTHLLGTSLGTASQKRKADDIELCIHVLRHGSEDKTQGARLNAALLLAQYASEGETTTDTILRLGGMHALLELVREALNAIGRDKVTWRPLYQAAVVSSVCVISCASDLRMLWRGWKHGIHGIHATDVDDNYSDRTEGGSISSSEGGDKLGVHVHLHPPPSLSSPSRSSPSSSSHSSSSASSDVDTVLHCVASALDLCLNCVPVSAPPSRPGPPSINSHLLFEVANVLARLSRDLRVHSMALAADMTHTLATHAPNATSLQWLLLAGQGKALPPSVFEMECRSSVSSESAVKALSSSGKTLQDAVWAADCNTFGARALPLLQAILDTEFDVSGSRVVQQVEVDLVGFFGRFHHGPQNDEWWILQARRRCLEALESLARSSELMRRTSCELLSRAHDGVEKLQHEMGDKFQTSAVALAWRYLLSACVILSPVVDFRSLLADDKFLRTLRSYLPFHASVELSFFAASILRLIVIKPPLGATFLANNGRRIHADVHLSIMAGSPSHFLHRSDSAPDRNQASARSPRVSGAGYTSRLTSLLSYWRPAHKVDEDVDAAIGKPTRVRSASDAPPPRNVKSPRTEPTDDTAAYMNGARGLNNVTPTRQPSPLVTAAVENDIGSATLGNALEAWEFCVGAVAKTGLVRMLATVSTQLTTWKPRTTVKIEPGVRPPAPPKFATAANIPKLGRPQSGSLQECLRITAIEVCRCLASSQNAETRQNVIRNGGVAVLAASARLRFEELQARKKTRKIVSAAPPSQAVLGLLLSGTTVGMGAGSGGKFPSLVRTHSQSSVTMAAAAPSRRTRASTEWDNGEAVRTKPTRTRPGRHGRGHHTSASTSLRKFASVNHFATARSASHHRAAKTVSEADAATSSAAASDSWMSASGSDDTRRHKTTMETARFPLRARVSSFESTDVDMYHPPEVTGRVGLPPVLSSSSLAEADHGFDANVATGTLHASTGQEQTDKPLVAAADPSTDKHLFGVVSALSNLANVISTETVGWYVEHGGLYILVAVLLHESKAVRALAQKFPASPVSLATDMYVHALSGVWQLINYGSAAIPRMAINSRGFAAAIGVFLRLLGPAYPSWLCMQSSQGVEGVGLTHQPRIAHSAEAALHISCIVASLSSSLVELEAPVMEVPTQPDYVNVSNSLFSAHILAGLLLLAASENAETARRALQSLVNISQLQLRRCPNSPARQRELADCHSNGNACLICSFGCVALDAAAKLAHCRICEQQFGISSDAPFVLDAFSYSTGVESHSHAFTAATATATATAAVPTSLPAGFPTHAHERTSPASRPTSPGGTYPPWE